MTDKETIENLTQLCIFLAGVCVQNARIRGEALSMPADKCKDHLRGGFTNIQGRQTIANLKELSKIKADNKAAQKGLSYLVDK